MGKIAIFKIILVFFVFSNVKAQEKMLEEKAIDYFCKNFEKINKEAIAFDVKFSGKTLGISSDAYDIAHCIGDINLLKDSIPISVFLDSLNNMNSKLKLKAKTIKYDCDLFKNKFFSKKIYSLSVFEAIEYKGAFYVELYLVNKRRSSWIFCVKFDKNKDEPSGFFIKYLSF